MALQKLIIETILIEIKYIFKSQHFFTQTAHFLTKTKTCKNSFQSRQKVINLVNQEWKCLSLTIIFQISLTNFKVLKKNLSV